MKRKLFSQSGAGVGRFLVGVIIVAVIAALFLAAAIIDGIFHIPRFDSFGRLLQELSIRLQELLSGIGR